MDVNSTPSEFVLIPFGKGLEKELILLVPGHTLVWLAKEQSPASACNVQVSGESRWTQQKSLNHFFGSPASEMTRCMSHQVELKATGPHTESLLLLQDFPEQIYPRYCRPAEFLLGKVLTLGKGVYTETPVLSLSKDVYKETSVLPLGKDA